VFIGILLLGLAYVWVKRDLEWIRTFRQDRMGVPDVKAVAQPAAPKPLDQPAAQEN
jgi:hypothetical protein